MPHDHQKTGRGSSGSVVPIWSVEFPKSFGGSGGAWERVTKGGSAGGGGGGGGASVIWGGGGAQWWAEEVAIQMHVTRRIGCRGWGGGGGGGGVQGRGGPLGCWLSPKISRGGEKPWEGPRAFRSLRSLSKVIRLGGGEGGYHKGGVKRPGVVENLFITAAPKGNGKRIVAVGQKESPVPLKCNRVKKFANDREG